MIPCVRVCVRESVCACVWIVCVSGVSACVCGCMRACVWVLFVCIYAYVQECVPVWLPAYIQCMCLMLCVCLFVRSFMFLLVGFQMRVCVHTCMGACVVIRFKLNHYQLTWSISIGTHQSHRCSISRPHPRDQSCVTK